VHPATSKEPRYDESLDEFEYRSLFVRGEGLCSSGKAEGERESSIGVVTVGLGFQ
jgi:hypothetical protein